MSNVVIPDSVMFEIFHNRQEEESAESAATRKIFCIGIDEDNLSVRARKQVGGNRAPFKHQVAESLIKLEESLAKCRNEERRQERLDSWKLANDIHDRPNLVPCHAEPVACIPGNEDPAKLRGIECRNKTIKEHADKRIYEFYHDNSDDPVKPNMYYLNSEKGIDGWEPEVMFAVFLELGNRGYFDYKSHVKKFRDEVHAMFEWRDEAEEGGRRKLRLQSYLFSLLHIVREFSLQISKRD